ncbi:hypothetical protein DU74_09950 [Methanosarcina mazei]|uniref:Uncharacterized protein n=1 Tax=Methanosarcina mazei TaxID=2209 RepID=A0A0F8PTQ1_METMZ|nr:hypothetical protein DU74_09950 [Methanosarcina mazei]
MTDGGFNLHPVLFYFLCIFTFFVSVFHLLIFILLLLSSFFFILFHPHFLTHISDLSCFKIFFS